MNVILSVVHNLDYGKMAPFLESFVATRSEAKMHLFVAGVSAENVKKMELPGVTIHPFRYLSFRQRQPLLVIWPVWRRLLASGDFGWKCALGKRVFHLASMRFILYYEFLSEHRGEFENVLLTDCRDVFFQGDPFSDNLGPGLHCFLEAKTQFIGKCEANSRMLGGSFGPQAVAELADRRVSCSGTTIGDVYSIMAYLRQMIELSACGLEMFGGSDQGVHNFIVHRNMVPLLHLHDNYDSSVFTAGCEAEEAFRWNAADEIIRDDGKPYPVLHQYDRYTAARERIHAKLRPTAAIKGGS